MREYREQFRDYPAEEGVKRTVAAAIRNHVALQLLWLEGLARVSKIPRDAFFCHAYEGEWSEEVVTFLKKMLEEPKDAILEGWL